MAVRSEVIERLTDDFDGTPAVETVRCALDGKAYPLDPNLVNAKEMRQVFMPYVDARRDTRGTRVRRTTKNTASGVDAKAVPAWVKASKVTVRARGRIPSSIVEQYLAR